MQELAGRLTALDPEASESLKVVSFFDALVANGAGAESIVRAGAMLSGVAAGAVLAGRPLRVDATGRRSTESTGSGAAGTPPSWPQTVVSGDTVAWIERVGPPHANDAMVVERMALALAIVEARRAPTGGQLEIALASDRSPGERAAAAHRLRFEDGVALRVTAATPEQDGHGTTALLATSDGLLRAAVIRAGDEPGPVAPIPRTTLTQAPEARASAARPSATRAPETQAATGGVPAARAGTALASGPHDLPRAWADARLALRLTEARHPLVSADELGALLLLARAYDPAAPVHPDAAALAALDDRARDTLHELVTAESVRAAAAALAMHHSSLQSRHDGFTRRLGYDPRSPVGRPRYEAARLLALLAR